MLYLAFFVILLESIHGNTFRQQRNEMARRLLDLEDSFDKADTKIQKLPDPKVKSEAEALHQQVGDVLNLIHSALGDFSDKHASHDHNAELSSVNARGLNELMRLVNAADTHIGELHILIDSSSGAPIGVVVGEGDFDFHRAFSVMCPNERSRNAVERLCLSRDVDMAKAIATASDLVQMDDDFICFLSNHHHRFWGCVCQICNIPFGLDPKVHQVWHDEYNKRKCDAKHPKKHGFPKLGDNACVFTEHVHEKPYIPAPRQTRTVRTESSAHARQRHVKKNRAPQSQTDPFNFHHAFEIMCPDVAKRERVHAECVQHEEHLINALTTAGGLHNMDDNYICFLSNHHHSFWECVCEICAIPFGLDPEYYQAWKYEYYRRKCVKYHPNQNGFPHMGSNACKYIEGIKATSFQTSSQSVAPKKQAAKPRVPPRSRIQNKNVKRVDDFDFNHAFKVMCPSEAKRKKVHDQCFEHDQELRKHLESVDGLSTLDDDYICFSSEHHHTFWQCVCEICSVPFGMEKLYYNAWKSEYGKRECAAKHPAKAEFPKMGDNVCTFMQTILVDKELKTKSASVFTTSGPLPLVVSGIVMCIALVGGIFLLTN